QGLKEVDFNLLDELGKSLRGKGLETARDLLKPFDEDGSRLFLPPKKTRNAWKASNDEFWSISNRTGKSVFSLLYPYGDGNEMISDHEKRIRLLRTKGEKAYRFIAAFGDPEPWHDVFGSEYEAVGLAGVPRIGELREFAKKLDEIVPPQNNSVDETIDKIITLTNTCAEKLESLKNLTGKKRFGDLQLETFCDEISTNLRLFIACRLVAEATEFRRTLQGFATKFPFNANASGDVPLSTTGDDKGLMSVLKGDRFKLFTRKTTGKARSFSDLVKFASGGTRKVWYTDSRDEAYVSAFSAQIDQLSAVAKFFQVDTENEGTIPFAIYFSALPESSIRRELNYFSLRVGNQDRLEMCAGAAERSNPRSLFRASSDTPGLWKLSDPDRKVYFAAGHQQFSVNLKSDFSSTGRSDKPTLCTGDKINRSGLDFSTPLSPWFFLRFLSVFDAKSADATRVAKDDHPAGRTLKFTYTLGTDSDRPLYVVVKFYPKDPTRSLPPSFETIRFGDPDWAESNWRLDKFKTLTAFTD
ncbi:MAG: hypothetical protein AAF517_26840, partial [Planctomycetota bacterium]